MSTKPPVKFALHSDVHFEFCRNPLPDPNVVRNTVDVVLLAGDIATGTDIVHWAAHYREIYNAPVVFVCGNHEYYGHNFTTLDHDIRELLKYPEFEHLYFANCDVIQFGHHFRVLGTTMWSDLYDPAEADDWFTKYRVQNRMADYQRINYNYRCLQPRDTQDVHHRSVQWLENILAGRPYPGHTIVLTHHGPLKEVEPSMYYGGSLSPAFTSDLTMLINRNVIDTWCFGHTHHNVDFEAFGTRLVSNQAGYPMADEGYDYKPHYAYQIPPERDDLRQFTNQHDLVMSYRDAQTK